MTAYNQEYEFDPTLTTSELSLLEAKKAEEAELRAEYERELEDERKMCSLESKLDEERKLRNLEREIKTLLADYIKEPTFDVAERLIADIDIYSDWYKDVNCVRPHGCWSEYFAQFGENHNRVWEEAYKAR